RPKPPLNRPPPPIGMPPPPNPPPPKPPNPPPSPRRSSILLLSSLFSSMAASPCSDYIWGDEPYRRHLEHKFRSPAHRQRRALPEVAQTRRAVPAGNQMPRRVLSASGVRGTRLQASPGPGDEGL